MLLLLLLLLLPTVEITASQPVTVRPCGPPTAVAALEPSPVHLFRRLCCEHRALEVGDQF
jgi:hypothetical protein